MSYKFILTFFSCNSNIAAKYFRFLRILHCSNRFVHQKEFNNYNPEVRTLPLPLNYKKIHKQEVIHCTMLLVPWFFQKHKLYCCLIRPKFLSVIIPNYCLVYEIKAIPTHQACFANIKQYQLPSLSQNQNRLSHW